jgi:hypothetical protein
MIVIGRTWSAAHIISKRGWPTGPLPRITKSCVSLTRQRSKAFGIQEDSPEKQSYSVELESKSIP